MPWQDLGQENAKGAPATAALAAIGTKHPLAPHGLPGAIVRIVPVEQTVAVQRLRAAAAGAALLLERKSRAFSS